MTLQEGGRGRGARFHQLRREKADQVVISDYFFLVVFMNNAMNIFSGGAEKELEGHLIPLWQCSHDGETTFDF